jgi:hypothetical protein
MLKEKGKELFHALTVIPNATTSLNLRDLEAEAVAKRGESLNGAAMNFRKERLKLRILTRRTFNSIQSPLLPCLVDLNLLRSSALLPRRLLFLRAPLLSLRLH